MLETFFCPTELSSKRRGSVVVCRLALSIPYVGWQKKSEKKRKKKGKAASAYLHGTPWQTPCPLKQPVEAARKGAPPSIHFLCHRLAIQNKVESRRVWSVLKMISRPAPARRNQVKKVLQAEAGEADVARHLKRFGLFLVKVLHTRCHAPRLKLLSAGCLAWHLFWYNVKLKVKCEESIKAWY